MTSARDETKRCPRCRGAEIRKNGKTYTKGKRQRYFCLKCEMNFTND